VRGRWREAMYRRLPRSDVRNNTDVSSAGLLHIYCTAKFRLSKTGFYLVFLSAPGRTRTCATGSGGRCSIR
jgi:hypothetical protein